jgi:hypothetical protein
MKGAAPIDAAVLPDGVRARIVPGVNGLAMHVLEAGEKGGRAVAAVGEAGQGGGGA